MHAPPRHSVLAGHIRQRPRRSRGCPLQPLAKPTGQPVPGWDLLGPLREDLLLALPLETPVAPLAPGHFQRAVPDRQILDPRTAHVIRLPADDHTAAGAGMLPGGLHDHDLSYPENGRFHRHNPKPWKVVQQRRNVTHRWPPADRLRHRSAWEATSQSACYDTPLTIHREEPTYRPDRRRRA